MPGEGPMKIKRHKEEEEIPKEQLQQALSVPSRNTKIKLCITLWDIWNWTGVSLTVTLFQSLVSKKKQAILFYVCHTKMSFPKILICSPRAQNKMIPFHASAVIFLYFPVCLTNPSVRISLGFFYKYRFLVWDTLFCFFDNSSFEHSSETL